MERRQSWRHSMQLATLSSAAVGALGRDLPVVVPVAALEQHGAHLPLFTDSYLLGEVVRRAGERLGDRILLAPLIWLGNSDHHLDFSGTLSVRPRVYLDLLAGVAEDCLRHGFRRLVFVNGHGGNDIPGRQVIFELRQRHRERQDLLLLFATYWLLGPAPRATSSPWAQTQMGHACEWETSMMLRLDPDLVEDYRRLPGVPFGQRFEPVARGWVTGDRSKPGHIGEPAAASAEKGEALFEHFAGQLADLLERVSAWDGVSW